MLSLGSLIGLFLCFVAVMVYQATKSKRLAFPLFCGGCFLVLLFCVSVFV